ncbi:MAG: sigma-54-dependent Fis family transcriptional regulator, partial [Rhodocyclaceae bacterium]|nr:sigma-54-dependent Fis family transcriptional regulator [Rhodocyclaceae bacterium]
PRIIIDGDFRILAANQAYARDFGGGDSSAVVGRRCYEVSHRIDVPCDQAGESCPLTLSARSGRPQRILHLHHTPRGEEHVDVEITPLPRRDGGPRLYVEAMHMVRHASSRPATQGLVGRSPAFLRMLEHIMRAAPSEATVLLLGETGTGKELAARALHEASRRADGPFVVVDCSGLTETLFESELFGYEKGAFTGATHRKTGLVEAARGGTLFLDEIGELPLYLQVKLLRLLETGTYRRVGGVEVLSADFRLVSATHRDLSAMVRSGDFRRDLYYRVNTFPIHTPSLAERSDDIPLLAQSLLERVAGHRHGGRRLTPAAMTALKSRGFEGNIRELRNLIERASLLADGEEIRPEHLVGDAPPVSAPTAAGGGFFLQAPVSLTELEVRYVAWALDAAGRDRKLMASTLGVSERTLYRLLRRSSSQCP